MYVCRYKTCYLGDWHEVSGETVSCKSNGSLSSLEFILRQFSTDDPQKAFSLRVKDTRARSFGSLYECVEPASKWRRN